MQDRKMRGVYADLKIFVFTGKNIFLFVELRSFKYVFGKSFFGENRIFSVLNRCFDFGAQKYFLFYKRYNEIHHHSKAEHHDDCVHCKRDFPGFIQRKENSVIHKVHNQRRDEIEMRFSQSVENA